ncbi:MAG: OmpA family protein [candidate division Zixibacteria bacterium]|nr:OmpA family protein [candidate division Zixibacteria bacterium]
MKRLLLLTAGICLFYCFGTVVAQSEFDALKNLMDSVQVMEGDIFAPKTYLKAEKKFNGAKRAITDGRKSSKIAKLVNEANEYAENTLKAAEVAKHTLSEYLEPRNLARTAKANQLVPELYGKAELQFKKATAKVESGDVKNGLKEANKSKPLFDIAELQAIKISIMGKADKLIEKAIQGDATKFSLSTLDKAKTARNKCDITLSRDRYEREESLKEIARAEYEAAHASNIARSVRSLKRNDQAWEKLMLVYEIQMNRVGEAIGSSNLPFDKGPIAAADSLILYIQFLQKEKGASLDLTDQLSAQLSATLTKTGLAESTDTPIGIAKKLDTQVSELISENKSLKATLEEERMKYVEIQESMLSVSAELDERTKKENKFKKAKTILNPSEGELLFNSSNDIVMRLHGLSFGVNRTDITDDHVTLLKKVQTIIEMFPESKLAVEGHTDASGDAATNRQLSEKRAYAVMQYLRQSMLISADRINAIGFGAEKPVASNKNPEGRAKNRRIDILIMQ